MSMSSVLNVHMVRAFYEMSVLSGFITMQWSSERYTIM